MFDSPTCRQCAARAASTRQHGEGAAAEPARPFPLPVPLLMQLARPLTSLEEIESLAAQLDSARARGCF